jgi:HD-like signal output (HDOD) protein
MDFGIARALADTPGLQAGMAGTPRYMAPEQILGRTIDQRSDVFALGILAYMLLTGRHPFPQENLAELREAIASQPHPPLGVTAPDLPENLYVWMERALAKKAADRFPDARAMLQAFDAGAAAEGAGTGLSTTARREFLDFIMKRIERQGDFPATAEYLSLVTRSARDETASAQKIAETILKDFALTNRILRLVNSPGYRSRGGPVTTISRAVVILGVDTILSLSTGLGIFEHFHNRCDIRELKLQAIAAIMTALHARQLAQLADYPEAEEAFITGMLYHLGRLIVAFYFPQEHRAILDLMVGGEDDEEKASRRVMRLSYSEIAQALAESWRLPEQMREGMLGLPRGHSGRAHGKIELLQTIVQCAEELAQASLLSDESARKAALDTLARRYHEQLPVINAQRLLRCIDDGVRNAMDVSHALKVDLQSLGIPETLIYSHSETNSDPPDADPLEASVRPMLEYEDGVDNSGAETAEEQRQDIIMRTVMEITTALMSPFQISDILMMVLEGMYRGLAFQHVMLAMVNPERNHVFCRFGLGPNIEAIRKRFEFPLNTGGGLPACCILESREIALLDIHDHRHDRDFPHELINMLHARSLVLLPIVIQTKPIGCFFVSRGDEQSQPSRQDLRDLRTLANQAILAIQHSLSRR